MLWFNILVLFYIMMYNIIKKNYAFIKKGVLKI